MQATLEIDRDVLLVNPRTGEEIIADVRRLAHLRATEPEFVPVHQEEETRFPPRITP